MKKVYKPLWSYDVQKTEEWLADMAGNGLIFERLNRWTRCFYFQERETETRIYRIAYDKIKSSVLPKTLQEEGWGHIATAGNWKFSSNSQPETAIQTSPVRDGIVKHNRFLTYLFLPMIFYFAIILLNFTISMMSSWIQYGGSNIEESPMWIVTYLFMAFVLGSVIFGIYSIVKITRTNRKLQGTVKLDAVSMHRHLDPQTEKELKKAGRLVRKVKFAWIYSPDKMEQWLESMELRGFHLHRVNKIGNVFYFIKGEPRRIAYRVDYQRGPTESYYAIHREAGWKEKFVSYSNMENWTIWSQAYEENEERPQLYSDRSSRLKHAKRIAITYTVLFFPLVAFYIYFIINIMMSADTIQDWFVWNSSGLFMIAVLIFGTFIFRIWAYYGRLRKQTSAWGN
ncbi:DUF2812 domain-containing protein [Planococcus salinarum]|uniref:DUF2812 domain-containing protein n=1 Tax=Planococcus salinarum TaxID=622695 RepID=UPI000E3D7301|nr:DUF2812 domain-containing protein [Planococcus salinarum]TAA73338.1 DUF2812 domain-containing protein [Planococcus salinarum]